MTAGLETIMFPYNIVENQGEELIRKCAEKGIGFIDMKPLAGGAIEDGRLALRYVCSNPDVTVTIPGMAEIAELEENIAACSDQTPLTLEEKEKMDEVRRQLGTNFCRRCNYCAPCQRRDRYSECFSYGRLSAHVTIWKSGQEPVMRSFR